MQGRPVYRFATRIMPDAARRALQKVDLTVDEVTLFVPHQANERILKASARGLGIPEERMYSNLARFGNTSSASVPMALCEAIERGRVMRDDLLVLVGFGAGLTWAATVIRWSLPLPVPAPSRRMTLWRWARYRWARIRSGWWHFWRRLDARLFRILYDRSGRRRHKDK
jgi:3-oxoacyl-[acyl-carrier-protein] synthase-3